MLRECMKANISLFSIGQQATTVVIIIIIIIIIILKLF
jgi:hypothetical protein